MKTPAQLYIYNNEVVTLKEESEAWFAENFHPETEPQLMHWLNFHCLTDKASIAELTAKMGWDKLTLEDIFHGTRRPRLEEYGNYVFFSIVSALPPEASGFSLKKERVSFILGENYLVSLQEHPSDHFPEVRERIEMRKGKIRSKGPDFLLFRLLEAIVENYDEVVNEIADRVVEIEKDVVRRHRHQSLNQIEWQKRKLIDLRKIVHPLRDIVSQLERMDDSIFKDENDRYYQHLRDACAAVVDEIDSQKQILEGVSNLYYAVQGQNMNEIMKVLTVISAIFIPLTFIVGVYGMNFDNMPELHTRNGYFVVMGIMFLMAVMLVIVFWKRGWLKQNK